MSLTRNVYEHVVQEIDGGATLDTVTVDDLLPATMTRQWYTEHRRAEATNNRYWDNDPLLRDFLDSFENRNTRNHQFGAAQIYGRNSSRSGEQAPRTRLDYSANEAGYRGFMLDSSSVPAAMLWYEHDNPMDAPALLADAPLGVIVGWSFDEFEAGDQSAEEPSPHLAGGTVWFPDEERRAIVTTWGEAMGLDPVYHPENDDLVVAWVAPEHWPLCPSLSQRFFLTPMSLMRSGMNFPRWLVERGNLSHETAPADEAEFSEDQVTEASRIITSFDAAIASVEQLNSGASTRLRDAQQQITHWRDRAVDLQQQHAAALSSQVDYEAQYEDAVQSIARLDASAILNRFDAAEEIAELHPVSSAELDNRGHISVTTHPFNMRGDRRSRPCRRHQSEGAWLGDPECDSCEVSGEMTVRIEPLHFTINTTNGSVHFDEDDLHPHLSGGSACWGAVGTALNDAVARQDFITLTHMVLGWATQYNPNSPHRRITSFREADGEPGWIVE